MNRLLFSLILTLICCISTGYASLPADISFVVLDIKYNEADGVKICEMQYGMNCQFKGLNFEKKRNGVIAEQLCDFFSGYFKRFWFVSRGGLSSEFAPILRGQKKWKEYKFIPSLLADQKFKKYGKMPVRDPSSIRDHHGLYVVHYKKMQQRYLDDFSGLLYLNKAFLPYFGNKICSDKYHISTLFDQHEALYKLKPRWNIYLKGDSKSLVQSILRDFSSEMVVLKPRTGHKGKGVLIVPREELQETLTYIFSTPKETLLKDPDLSYNYWGKDKHPNFLVEEYYPSDPVQIPHLGEGFFDGTMRVGILLWCNRGEITVRCLGHFWKLPSKSLEEEASPTDKHKSFWGGELDRYGVVAEETKEKVSEQLSGPFSQMYRELLQKCSHR